jgi:hypothetical protein
MSGHKGMLRRPLEANEETGPVMAPANRKCAEESCTTVLSRYNKSPFCFRHAPRLRPHNNGLDVMSEANRRRYEQKGAGCHGGAA